MKGFGKLEISDRSSGQSNLKLRYINDYYG